jgi:hypothetical protein
MIGPDDVDHTRHIATTCRRSIWLRFEFVRLPREPIHLVLLDLRCRTRNTQPLFMIKKIPRCLRMVVDLHHI